MEAEQKARLVRFVAEQVMGWTAKEDAIYWWPAHESSVPTHETIQDWDPLTNDHHAGQVVDRMAALGFEIKLESSLSSWEAWFIGEGYVDARPEGNAWVEVTGNPPTADNYRAARLEAQTLAAARASGWEE